MSIMKISTFNANSIRSRMPILSDWIVKEKPDFLGIQETKVQDFEFPEDLIKNLGYHVYYKGEKSYNGVAIISKEKADEITFGFNDGGPADETRLICARYSKLSIVNTYIPQGRSIDHIMYKYKLGWYNRLKNLFNDRFSRDESIAWIGDMNIATTPLDVTNYKTKKNDPCCHEEARKAFIDVCSFGFNDLLRNYHPDEEIYSFFDYRVKDAVQRNIGWRIDYILTTNSLTERSISCDIDIEPRKREKPSDHTFVTATFRD